MQEKDILEDAQVKFQKLCEMANELNEGIVQDGDHTARQFVLTAVLKSDNRFLYEIMEEALFDDNYQDTLKTIISGIFLILVGRNFFLRSSKKVKKQHIWNIR